MELSVLRRGGERLVPQHALFHEVREGDLAERFASRSPPPDTSKRAEVRYSNIGENDEIDDDQIRDWIR